MVFVRRAAMTRAPKLGEYPSAAIASATFRRVSGATLSGKFRQRETVAVETSAALATSCRVGVGREVMRGLLGSAGTVLAA